MELKLYDTLTREKRVFTPLDPANVRMYVCGPTVYDFAHIGNARPVIVFDVLFRLLRHIYGEKHVTYVRNITDVDDKINARALRDFPKLPLNDAIRKVTEKTANQFHADVAALGCLQPTHEPRATEHIAEMIDIIGKLLENGFAYIAHGTEGREVLFSVEKMPRYGELSNRKLDEQKEGARVAVESHKRNAADFVLWKESSPSEPGWPAEFPADGVYPANSGKVDIYGRPGWHIECSAMAWKYLGKTFDIHGGGIDLVFPHHENEIAQSCCAFHTDRMAQTWMHNGFLQIEGEKMSKSTGNFMTISDLLENLPGDVLRLQMLMTNYRSPIDWTERSTFLARNELEEWGEALHSYFNFKNDHRPIEVAAALADDLNTPKAISVLRELFVSAKKGGHSEKLAFAANCRLLGFSNLDKPGYFRTGVSGMNLSGVRLGNYDLRFQKLRAAYANRMPIVVDAILSEIRADGLSVDVRNNGDLVLTPSAQTDSAAEIERLLLNRTAARARKDFAESDRIRDELAAMGVAIKDGKDADGKPVTTWEIAR